MVNQFGLQVVNTHAADYFEKNDSKWVDRIVKTPWEKIIHKQKSIVLKKEA